MEKRRLGNTGFEIAPLVFGGNVFGWTADEHTSYNLLDVFIAAGFSMIDTADVYSAWGPGNKGGESETIIGNWLKLRGHRDDVIIATKVGSEMGPGRKGLSKKYLLSAAEDSLRRLQTDHIDLYQSHYDDPDAPIEETLEAFSELIKQGKVIVIGASNYSAARLAESLEISNHSDLPRYESLQPLYNLYDRAQYETELESLCIRNGLGVITYFSLASGFLTGKYRSEVDFAKSTRGSRVRKYFNERGLRIIAALDSVGARYNATSTQIALAWVIAHPGVTAPIASATSIEQLTELIDSTRIRLDESAIKELNDASAYATAHPGVH